MSAAKPICCGGRDGFRDAQPISHLFDPPRPIAADSPFSDKIEAPFHAAVKDGKKHAKSGETPKALLQGAFAMPPLRPPRMLELIGKLYDAALDPTLWPAVAPALAEICNSPSMALLSIENGAGQFLSRTANFDEKAQAEYSEHYHQTDIWAEGAIQQGLGSVRL
ncbi:MAG: hypothetical protein ACREFH_11495, partial [Stellaceae bacterium]